ncbi:uncharacterized protein ACN427_010419 isoform 1-T1 [Glossina fuscipes fuscipes]
MICLFISHPLHTTTSYCSNCRNSNISIAIVVNVIINNIGFFRGTVEPNIVVSHSKSWVKGNKRCNRLWSVHEKKCKTRIISAELANSAMARTTVSAASGPV